MRERKKIGIVNACVCVSCPYVGILHWIKPGKNSICFPLSRVTFFFPYVKVQEIDLRQFVISETLSPEGNRC